MNDRFKRNLSRLGEAAISAVMTESEIAADPVRAFNIAQAAMRATVRIAAGEQEGSDHG